VAVVGGGVIGLACGWRVAQRGLRVCVLERGRPGGGATYAAAGLLTPVTDAEFGEEALMRLSLESAELYPAFAAELEHVTGHEVGYERTGSLYVALDRDEVEALRRLHGLHERLGLEAEWLSGRDCRSVEPGLATSCAGGVRVTSEAQVDPRRLAAALAGALAAAGGELRTSAEVVEARRSGDRIVGLVTTDGREVLADRVVVAAGCWSGTSAWLPPELTIPVRPVKGQILRLRAPAGTRPAALVVRTGAVYIVPRATGEVVVGATEEERGFDTTVTAGGVHELLREAYRALPEIAELEFVEACARLRPGSPDNAPLIGASVDGLVVATGHYRKGILLAPVTADAIAAELAGEPRSPGLEEFVPSRFEAAPLA
jgi:glycine oxidase